MTMYAYLSIIMYKSFYIVFILQVPYLLLTRKLFNEIFNALQGNAVFQIFYLDFSI